MTRQLIRCLTTTALCLAAVFTAAPAWAQSWTLQPGQQLNPGDAVLSPDGEYELYYDPSNGALVLFDLASWPTWNPTNVWMAPGTYGTTPGVALMQYDGNFVVYSSSCTGPYNSCWSTGTFGYAGAFLQIQDQGNVVIYSGTTPVAAWGAGGGYGEPAPSLTSLSPSSGPVGTAVNIYGANFGRGPWVANAVTFGGIPAAVTAWYPDFIQATVPSGVSGAVNVVVTANGYSSNALSFIAPLIPTLTSLSTSSGPYGTLVTITGTNFGASSGTSAVTFNGTGSATPLSWSSTSIVVRVPPCATSGNVVVTVNGIPSNGLSFSVQPLTGHLFTTGQAICGGQAVFSVNSWYELYYDSTNGSLVLFDIATSPATNLWTAPGTLGTSPGYAMLRGDGYFAVYDGSGVQRWVAPQPAAVVDVQVDGNLVGYSDLAETNPVWATNTQHPLITSLSPTSGPVGVPVTITGVGFHSAPGYVTFNGTPATPTTWTGTTIVAPVPAGATTGNVVVATVGLNGVPYPSHGSFVFTVGDPDIGSPPPDPPAGTVVYYHTDAIGSVRMTTAQNAQVVARYDYLPFGEQWNPAGSDPRMFTGAERDTTTGFDYLGERYYSNLFGGRFTTPDSSAFLDPTNPQSLNLYAYAYNNPLRWVDPTGHDDECPADAKSDICETVIGKKPPDISLLGLQLSLMPSPFENPMQSQQANNPSCRSALQTAGQTPAAVNRAIDAWPVLSTAGRTNNISAALLAAVGVRESGFRNVSEFDGKGVGVGVFQLTVSGGSRVSAAQAANLPWAANFAASLLHSNMTTLATTFPRFTSGQLLQATAASYNFGVPNIWGNPNTIDRGTAHNNYGQNVVNLMTCFGAQ
jgi:RHS repeat-associated protein